MRPTPRAVADFGLCLAAAVAWTWPYARRLDVALRDLYDGQGLLWVLSWVRHALVHDPANLFQANALAPARDVLAFSEPLLGYGVLAVPLSLPGLSELAIFNTLCLLGTAFTPWAISRLAMALGADRFAALLGALLASFSALTVAHLGFVSFVASGGIALVVLAFLRLERGNVRGILLAGLSLAGLGYFSLQLLSFALAALGVLTLVTVARHRSVRDARVVETVLAGLVAGILLVPLAVPLLRARQSEGFSRTVAETQLYAARPRDFLATTSFNPGQTFLPYRDDAERPLYPGTLVLALAVLGVAFFRGEGHGDSRRIGAVLVLVGAFGSLGYDGPLYPALAAAAPPLFKGIRAAARFAFVLQIGMGLLAALGVSWLLGERRRWSRAATVLALLALGALELRQTVPFDRRPASPPKVDDFLAAADVGGPILHLPAAFRISNDADYLVSSTRHFKPIVNGVTSNVPQRFFELSELLSRNPVPAEAWDTLAAWPVAAIVLHEGKVPLETRESTLKFLADGVARGELDEPLAFPHQGHVDALFSVRRVRGARPFGPSGGGDPRANAQALAALAAGPHPAIPAKEDDSFGASIDAPADGGVVKGNLVVSGWSQTEGGNASVLEVRIDGARRVPASSRRVPRPDVAAALPALGDTGAAGYEETFAFLPGDEGRHDLAVRFQARDGRVRTLAATFVWRP
ncbi:MAG: hypothetical protein JNK60_01420 [Acidobacteria bacterium]|nr:hypothetical protein [Acidobacteriota bacterium]